MRELDALNTETYLRDRGHIGPHETVRVRELAGGVSNMVLLVEREQGDDRRFVVKQARSRLRTERPWFSSVERNWREAEVLRACSRLIDERRRAHPSAAPLSAMTPRILSEDRAEYLFAMTAAPEPNSVWKHDLLQGRARPEIAAACGVLLATLHGGSWLDRELQTQLGDRTLFDQLRVEPYYRTLAQVQPDARQLVNELIASIDEHVCALVHADFSPKNLLVYPGGLMMVDFETGHFGDPAFDLGFFTSHLALKACYHAPRHREFLDLGTVFAQAYSQEMLSRIGETELLELWRRGLLHLAGCAWARLDGKSPVDYLTDPERRDAMRAACRDLAQLHPRAWPDVLNVLQGRFDTLEPR